MMKIVTAHAPLIGILVATMTAAMLMPSPVMAFDLGFLSGMSGAGDGDFAVGSGVYRAPDEAINDSGLYGFARYRMSQLAFEIDYGLSEQPFFLGAADYLYDVPTGTGITQTEVAIGGGITFVNNDPAFDESKFGPNLLGQVRFMDNLAVQVRYDFLGESANLWTFGLSYAFY